VPDDPRHELVAAIDANDAARVRQALDRYPELTHQLDEPMPGLPFDSQPLLGAVWSGNREMVDVLLAAGADINARTRWWAGGFGVLDGADPGLASYLIERGAIVDAHAAARLGMLEELEQLVSNEPRLVRARGGDGQTPLHCASSVTIAKYLIDHGADVDARDVDHESTPAQYMVSDRQEVARYLITRGCRNDILMASALGDLGLVTEHLDADPECIRMRVSEAYFPKQDPRSGGTIYIWTLGWHKSAHAVAREKGHHEILRLLMERSPLSLQLAIACELGDERRVKEVMAAQPNLPATLSADDRSRLAAAAHDNNTEAVRLMLEAGWPPEIRGELGGTPLHWAAWHGNAVMVREILRYRPAVDVKDDTHQGTPLGWAIHGSLHGWQCKTGDYAGTVEALLEAGATPPDVGPELVASDAVLGVLRRHASS
jgi:ankyrin repeat protein